MKRLILCFIYLIFLSVSLRAEKMKELLIATVF